MANKVIQGFGVGPVSNLVSRFFSGAHFLLLNIDVYYFKLLSRLEIPAKAKPGEVILSLSYLALATALVSETSGVSLTWLMRMEEEYFSFPTFSCSSSLAFRFFTLSLEWANTAEKAHLESGSAFRVRKELFEE